MAQNGLLTTVKMIWLIFVWICFMAEICLKGLNCFLCLCAMKIFLNIFKSLDLYGTFWRAEQLSVVVSKFDISPVSDSAILSFSSSFRWNNLEETKIWVPWMHIRYIQWGHPSEENAHAMENFLICGGMWKGGGGKTSNFFNPDWVWRLPLEEELVSSTHRCLKNNPADLERWSIIPSSQFIIWIGPKDVSVICWNWIEITLIPMCGKITLRLLRYILYSLCKG